MFIVNALKIGYDKAFQVASLTSKIYKIVRTNRHCAPLEFGEHCADLVWHVVLQKKSIESIQKQIDIR